MTDTTTSTQAGRPQTEVDRIAERYFDAMVELSPINATYLGVPGHDEDLDDLSPAGNAAQSQLRQRTLEELRGATPTDDVDKVTVAAMTERLGLAEERYAAGLDEMSLNVIASPLQGVRDVFDLMRQDSVEDWRVFATRMAKIPQALEGYKESLLAARDRGLVAPQRQVVESAKQSRDLTAEDGYFAKLVADARTEEAPLDGDVKTQLAEAAQAASAAYGAIADWLERELLPHAPEADACGRERYALESRYFLGASVDLEETYRWGQEQVADLHAQMQAIAEGLEPGASVERGVEILDADERYHLRGTDALKAWMQERADEVITNLKDVHFDIPGPVQRIECMIAPTQTGGIYYTGPSDDFSRPGRMWWSVPKGNTEFRTWNELTTVYHEGVPGHHLQVAQTVYRSELLNKWRRLESWTSGHGEGWALYAERLMAELGYMDDPGNRMGWLAGQSLRAARVVIDIGVHCGFEAPEEVGGGEWTYDKAWTYLTRYGFMDEKVLRFELNRYLGWPGQAPAYKIGERLWLQLRDEVKQREGDAFDLKTFHRRALDIGGVGLDTLRAAVLGTL
ncbi:hypothetical protein N864_02660 [Intrasporangium chromatireducens Q5-1]|uniref:DUF885 domain-containing protein n=1 Tax=Intrasporangium chromatireducens Q5-1 TaxID=584657 RepID=W9GHP4_9MICO|nr:DUF885 domain-containing protein [Intrasporangium chromatireducens]EWT05751.1 hypothetical protein N864_02660 [Intrasporangium chromatireducens Q5-1]